MKMPELMRLAAAERMIPEAPILASSAITIRGPRDRVWCTMTDVATWETGHPYLKNAALGGAFAPGSPLSYGGLP